MTGRHDYPPEWPDWAQIETEEDLEQVCRAAAENEEQERVRKRQRAIWSICLPLLAVGVAVSLYWLGHHAGLWP